MRTLTESTHIGRFLDDPNKTLDDKIDNADPDEPLRPAIDTYWKDNVKLKEQIVMKRESTEGDDIVDPDLNSSRKSIPMNRRRTLHKRVSLGMTQSSSFKESKIGHKSQNSINEDLDCFLSKKLEPFDPADYYKDGINGN